MSIDSNDLPHLVDHLLLNHGTATMLALGSTLLVIGYLGLHGISRRRFYRKKQHDPFPSYSRCWLITNLEGYLGVLFLLMGVTGFLCLFAGFIDLIDD
ncbi:MAG: hypothetical protein R3F19_12700 [Verrucomicrobiales bacterium]